MSKVKSPQEKKRDSLLKDRRNVYGECPASSRKNIRLGKQRSSMALRRAVAEDLRSIKGTAAKEDIDAVEGRAKDRLVELARASFKKKPDAPLAIVVDRKAKRRKGEQEAENVPMKILAEFRKSLRDETRLLGKIRNKP
jgi:hypothetical protein